MQRVVGNLTRPWRPDPAKRRCWGHGIGTRAASGCTSMADRLQGVGGTVVDYPSYPVGLVDDRLALMVDCHPDVIGDRHDLACVLPSLQAPLTCHDALN